MPDFDIDFCYERRQEVIDYVVQKYGSDHVAQIITFGTMAARRQCGTWDGPWRSVPAGGHGRKTDPQRAGHDHRQGAFRGAESSREL